MKNCFQCKKEWEGDKPGRAEVCSSCGADLKVCYNCDFYEPGAYNDCRESQADRVLEKDKANYCDYFKFRSTKAPTVQQKKKNDARKAFDDLFGD